MIAWLRALLCPHPTVHRKRDDAGVLYLVCASCRYRERAIRRSPEDFARLQRLQQRRLSSTTTPGRVLPMRRVNR